MNKTESHTPDTKIKTRRRPPQPRASAEDTTSYDIARREFEQRAQQWLALRRPERLVRLPQDLDAVTLLGVPCRCGKLIYRHRQESHSVIWTRRPGQHWAAAITTSCPE